MILLDNVNLTDEQMNQCFDLIDANESCSVFIVHTPIPGIWLTKRPNGKVYAGYKHQIMDLIQHERR